jgi:hypothetical protein
MIQFNTTPPSRTTKMSRAPRCFWSTLSFIQGGRALVFSDSLPWSLPRCFGPCLGEKRATYTNATGPAWGAPLAMQASRKIAL